MNALDLIQDENGMFDGGFFDLSLGTQVSDQNKNQNCDNTGNQDQNTNCKCKCDGGPNTGG